MQIMNHYYTSINHYSYCNCFLFYQSDWCNVMLIKEKAIELAIYKSNIPPLQDNICSYQLSFQFNNSTDFKAHTISFRTSRSGNNNDCQYI